jgi:hypothetical protein
LTNAKIASLSPRYSIVDQPEFGVIECLRKGEGEEAAEEMPNSPVGNNGAIGDGTSTLAPPKRWSLCSQFFQSDIDALAIRYRHTNANRSRADNVDFQVIGQWHFVYKLLV